MRSSSVAARDASSTAVPCRASRLRDSYHGGSCAAHAGSCFCNACGNAIRPAKLPSTCQAAPAARTTQRQHRKTQLRQVCWQSAISVHTWWLHLLQPAAEVAQQLQRCTGPRHDKRSQLKGTVVIQILYTWWPPHLLQPAAQVAQQLQRVGERQQQQRLLQVVGLHARQRF